MNELLKNIDIKKYEGLVVHIARRYANKSGVYIEDELVSAGYEGLLDAIDRFDIKKGEFNTYAQYRIEGAILDELRNLDHYTRTTRQWANKIKTAIFKIELKKMAPVNDYEIANELEITIDKYNKIILKIHNSACFSIDDYLNIKDKVENKTKTFHEINFGYDPDLINEIHKKEFKLIIKKAVSKLSEREQLVVELYYYENYTMKKIGHIIDRTESRVCQINQEIIKKLKCILETYNE